MDRLTEPTTPSGLRGLAWRAGAGLLVLAALVVAAGAAAVSAGNRPLSDSVVVAGAALAGVGVALAALGLPSSTEPLATTHLASHAKEISR